MVQDIEKLLGQYADDIDMYLFGSPKNVKEAFECIEGFSSKTGFKINYNKTTMYRVGSLCNSKAVHYTQKQLLWEDEKINVLGVFVTNDTRKVLQLNYSELIYQKVPSILALWARRNFSLFGKVLIVNTLVASLFVYKMTVLPLMPQEYITKLNQCFTNFLWNNRKPKIKIEIL